MEILNADFCSCVYFGSIIRFRCIGHNTYTARIKFYLRNQLPFMVLFIRQKENIYVQENTSVN